jgi:CheY-like chemotaxis protein
MDDMMPKMSGTETLKEIQKNELYDGPVVALTANALTGMKEKYIELGFTDYLAKPIEKAAPRCPLNRTPSRGQETAENSV